mmetsp:Transcript_2311/g.3227  ORF Transcript_2311/g.3227 Transcript_2311/m.3227 type:complete len:210 (-) Transcript_2311:311-940(-)
MENLPNLLGNLDLSSQLEELPPHQVKQPVKVQVSDVLDGYGVFKFGDRERDQELARKLYDALLAVDPHTARHIAISHTNICQYHHEQITGNFGKWDIYSLNEFKIGYIRMRPDYIGNIFLHDDELGNVYGEICGLVKENFQASNNIKLTIKTDQLGEMVGDIRGILLLTAEGDDGHRLRGRLELSTLTHGNLPFESSGSSWDFFGIRCI